MKDISPYQILFPIGIISSLAAVGVWLFGVHIFSIPTIFIHTKLIVGGFLWSFIVGFLMTAVPKMTGTQGAKKIELAIAVFLIITQMFLSWRIDGRWFYLNQMILVLFMMTFAGRRIFNAKKDIPFFFSHVGFGMVLAFIGAYYYYQQNRIMGIHLLHLGSVLMLVLGIGSRFFSFLSGLASEFETAPKSHHLLFHCLGAVMSVFLYLAGTGYSWAYLGLSIISLTYMIFIWKVFRRSERPSALKYGVRIVATMIPASFLMCWLIPDLYITFFHFLFISCFGLITYAVATRVTLAHGSYSLDMEMKSPSLWLFLLFLLLASLSRMIYGVSEIPLKTYSLNLAAIFWILAILCWCSTFAKKILIPGKQSASC